MSVYWTYVPASFLLKIAYQYLNMLFSTHCLEVEIIRTREMNKLEHVTNNTSTGSLVIKIQYN